MNELNDIKKSFNSLKRKGGDLTDRLNALTQENKHLTK